MCFRTLKNKDLRLKLHYGDLTDSSSLTRLIQEIRPSEIYNLGAQSHVAVSFQNPEYTADVDGIGALRYRIRYGFLNSKITRNSTKRLRRNFMARCRKVLSLKPPHFTREVPMLLQKCLRIGPLSIIARHLEFLLAMESCSITSRLDGVKLCYQKDYAGLSKYCSGYPILPTYGQY